VRGSTTSSPASVPAGAVEAARDTLGGAVAVSEGLPTGIAEQLLVAARDAFTQGSGSSRW
jgi:DHA2 family multidrug resistance protein-like MFS transporter